MAQKTPSAYPVSFAILLAFSLLFFAMAGCSGAGENERPLDFDACAGVECSDGLSCVEESGLCQCTEFSCGEGRSCSDNGRSCVENPQARCALGERWEDDQGCICDPTVCDGSGWACSEDGQRCQNELSSDSCIQASPWDGQALAFRNATADYGLVDIGPEGVRISTGDVTGNGFADLLVRRAGAHSDDFGTDGDRHIWLLGNTGQGSFEDITQESGLLQRRNGDSSRGRPAEVVAMADINNNGALDMITLFSNSAQEDPTQGAEVMWNDGQGNFTLGPVSSILHAAGQTSGRSGASFADVDRNGNVDLFIGQTGEQNLLLLGDGQGNFTDATVDRGLATVGGQVASILNEAGGHGHTWSVAACDLDGNGTPNFLAGNYGRAPNHLWYGVLDGEEAQYQNHSVASGYAFDHRQDWSDNESARCYCMHNRNAEDCADVPEPAYIVCNSAADAIRWNHHSDRNAYRLGGNSGTTVCADLNNNGRLDLLTTEIVHWDVGSSSDPSEILYNDGQSPPGFERPGNDITGLTRPRSGVTWDDGDITAAAFDFDNDGRLDILIASTDYPGTRALLYHQQPDGTFEAVPVELGIDLTSAHGIAVADFNGDGALDVVLGHSRFRCSSGDHCLDEAHVRLFENQAGQTNNWLQIELEGAEGTNRAAIGAQITLRTEALTQVSEVGGGHGHYGMQHDLVQHFGLGESCEAVVVVRWPDRELSEEIYRLPAGHRYRIRQGELPEVVDP